MQKAIDKAPRIDGTYLMLDLSLIQDVQMAFEAAKGIRRNAYAKYSRHHVSAALQCKNHKKLFLGVNLENASNGATVCAERNAFGAARAELGKFEAEFIVIVSPGGAPSCGLCLQVMSEFVGPEFLIYTGTDEGLEKKYEFKELMPREFTEFKQDDFVSA